MFNSNYTKWIPLGNYSHAGSDYIVFVRKNIKNGMMQFKTKIANPSWFSNRFLPIAMIDVKKAWDEICSI